MMINITDCVKSIRQAILGKEVRESIARGIEICYEDVEKGTQQIDEKINVIDEQQKEIKYIDTEINSVKKSLYNTEVVEGTPMDGEAEWGRILYKRW